MQPPPSSQATCISALALAFQLFFHLSARMADMVYIGLKLTQKSPKPAVQGNNSWLQLWKASLEMAMCDVKVTSTCKVIIE